VNVAPEWPPSIAVSRSCVEAARRHEGDGSRHGERPARGRLSFFAGTVARLSSQPTAWSAFFGAAFFAVGLVPLFPTDLRASLAAFFLAEPWVRPFWGQPSFQPTYGRVRSSPSLSPLTQEPEFHQIIHALSPAAQSERTKLIADGLPVRATTPIGSARLLSDRYEIP